MTDHRWPAAARIMAMHIGQPRTLRSSPDNRPWTTTFIRQPHPGPLSLSRLGLEGDRPADTRHHGGPDKAVLMYSAQHYPAWRQRYPEAGFGPGGFAENWTVEGLDEETVCIGDVYAVGTALVEVCQPRVPCYKISKRWGIPSLTEEVRASGWTGWYVRVLEEGEVETGATLQLLHRPYPALTVARVNDLLTGRLKEAALRQAVYDCPALADGIRSAFAP